MKMLIHIFLLLFAAFLCHLASWTTSFGAIRFELPFFLAYFFAIRDPSKGLNALVFFVSAVFFDVLDAQFAGCLAHLLLFFFIRRTRSIVNFTRFPANLLFGLALAALDRILYGFLVGFKLGVGLDLAFKSILDPAYALTVLFFPLVSSRARA